LFLARSWLFVPAQREHMVAKAATYGADVAVLDLEEAVPSAEKSQAREIAGRHIASLAEHAAVYVRVNDVRSGITRDDLLATVRPGLTGVMLPKADAPQDLRDLDVLLREAELAAGMRPGDVGVAALIESARGLLRCQKTAGATDRLAALAVGGYDYTADLGVDRNREGTALAHIRYTVTNVAVAFGMIAIDTPYADIPDEEGLLAETRFAKAVGMKGKLAVHPSQVGVINEVYTPDEGEVAEAQRIVETFESGVAEGLGAVSLDGRMLDGPIVERARRTIALSEAIAARGR
jgi:citrate lyase subunit beta / citryl-CoA lyase